MMAKPRQMPFLWQIAPRELTEKDKDWLRKALKGDYHGMTVDKILESGFYQIWRCGKEEGIIVTEIVVFNGDCFVCADYLAMKGYFEKLDIIEDCLIAFAKDNNCRGILLSARRKGLQRLYEKRYKELTRTYVKEII